MELAQTVELMCSDDYKERFQAEYYQLCIRFWRLVEMTRAWDEGKLTFTPSCPRSTYNIQLNAMSDYIAIMEARAVMEGIPLPAVEEGGK